MPNSMPGGQRLPALLELALVDNDSLNTFAIRHERLAGELRRAGCSHEIPTSVLLEKTELDSSTVECAGVIIERDPVDVRDSSDTALTITTNNMKSREL